MSEVPSAARELSDLLREISLPRGFLESYDLLECLSHGRGTETYLARHKGSQKLCLAKCYDRKIYGSVREGEILRSLKHRGLPAFLDEYRDDAAVCLVREYIEGTPLDRYAAGHGLSEERIVDICAELCDILSYLHGRTPPVIHRDVKPQNIIVRDSGHIALIDFDIARTYDADAETDTRFIATRAYAPPEQYGFSQTDGRADIYALGVLLCFLLTGETDVKNAEIPNRRLAAVVRRCAAFSPEKRFADAAAVRRALRNADGRGRKKLIRMGCSAALALVCLCAGFGVGRYTDFPSGSSGVRFAEPVVERAVRVQLGKGEAEPLSKEELLAVRELYIFGNEVSKTEEAFAEGLGGSRSDTPRGTLTSLADVRLLPNLEVLYVNYQTLSDLSPVSELPYLTYVNFRHTFVADVSPLAGLPRLRSVTLYDTRVADMSALAACPSLKALDAGRTPIPSLDALPEAASLESLSLAGSPFASLEGIERFAGLRYLSLRGMGTADLSALKKLPGLVALSVDETMRGAAEALGDTAFEIRFE